MEYLKNSSLKNPYPNLHQQHFKMKKWKMVKQTKNDRFDNTYIDKSNKNKNKNNSMIM